MNSNKLKRLLNSLEKREYARLKKFINSTYFNTNSNVITYFDFILSKVNTTGKDIFHFTREEAFSFVYPNEKFNATKLIRLNSDLIKLVEKFLAYQEITLNDQKQKSLFVSALRRRNLTKEYIQKSQEVIDELESKSIKASKDHLELFLLQQDVHFYNNNLMTVKEIPFLINAQKQLDTFYLITKLKLACEIICVQNTFKINFEIPLLNEVKNLGKKHAGENKLFQLFLLILKNIEGSFDEGALQELKVTFFKNLDLLSHQEQISILRLIININGVNINLGKSKDWEGQLELYQQGMEKHILIVNKKITPETFSNIIILAINLNKFDWVENFVNQYKSFLSDDVSENCQIFYEGYLSYSKREYEEAINKLWNCQFGQLTFDIRTKSILVRALTELFEHNQDKYDFCFGQISTIEKYIRRRKSLSDIKANAYLTFIKSTKKYINLIRRNKLDKNETDKLRSKILTEVNMIGREWLVGKLV